MTFIIGLTGGIGSGKSLVSRLFSELGIYIIDTDDIAHTLSQPPSFAIEAVTREFGQHYLNKDGTLDRAKLRTCLFQGPMTKQKLARKKLEAIFHPLIHTRVIEILQKKDIITPYFILAVPLLFETKNYQTLINRSLVVDCSVEKQIERTMARGLSRSIVEHIIKSQLPRSARLEKADDIVENEIDGLANIHTQLLTLHQRYLQLSVI